MERYKYTLNLTQQQIGIMENIIEKGIFSCGKLGVDPETEAIIEDEI
jgi:hypothetical protein